METDSLGIALGGGILIGWLVTLAITVLMVVSMWKIFTKAGRPGWEAIIPYYSFYVMYEIAWGNGWLFLLNLIPFVGFVVNIMATYKLAKSFEQGVGTTIGLLVLPAIFYPMLAFSNAQYIGPQA